MLKFIRTCRTCPEQYDVYEFDGNKLGKQVGYIRLRLGWLRCDYPDCGGETIFSHYFEDEIGCFDNEEQRQHFLNIIADKIKEKTKETSLPENDMDYEA